MQSYVVSYLLAVQRAAYVTFVGETSKFRFKASQLWNELPNELKQIQSENFFKLQLKTYLLKNCNQQL